MSSATPGCRHATVEDLLAIPEAERFHGIVDGELVHKALPSSRHGAAQAELTTEIAGAYGPRARGRGPGGMGLPRAEPFDAVEFSVHGLLAGDEGE
ncbi:hypothetical protein [Sorangium sp. So ce1335]|uniref:hypothetical protein n=1 Tax=Sorangium sp. So ce1335 TaxID=3133335 RepID=UPI003F5F3C52